MKSGIHPEYKLVTVACACGETFQTRSTKGNIRVEICSKCHPFFTGKQKFIDTAGRVERFQRKFSKKKLSPASASAGRNPERSAAQRSKPAEGTNA